MAGIKVMKSAYPKNWDPKKGYSEWMKYIRSEVQKMYGISKKGSGDD